MLQPGSFLGRRFAQGTGQIKLCIRWKPVQGEVSGVQELPVGGPLVVNKEKLENMYLSVASRES